MGEKEEQCNFQENPPKTERQLPVMDDAYVVIQKAKRREDQ
jgi:hypothetical protein